MKNMRGLSRNRKLLLGHVAAASLISVIFPQYLLFWKSRGVEGFEASLVEGTFVIVAALAGVPMGMLADKFGRKKVMKLGSLLSFLGLSGYLLDLGFWGFVASETLLGLAISASGCSVQALMVESVKQAGGSPDDELKATAQMRICCYATFVIGCFLGGYAASVHELLPFLLSSIGSLSAFILSFFLVETASAESEKKARVGFKAMLALRHRLTAGDEMSRLLISSMMLAGLLNAGVIVFQPHFQSIGLTTMNLGLMMAFSQVLLIAVTKKLTKLPNAASNGMLRSMAFSGIGSAHLSIALIQAPVAALFSWFLVFTRAYVETVLTVGISQEAKDEERGTILGLRSLLDNAARFAVLLLVGWFADSYGAINVFLVVGTLSFLLGARVLIQARQTREVT